jgi:hypothetical protein
MARNKQFLWVVEYKEKDDADWIASLEGYETRVNARRDVVYERTHDKKTQLRIRKYVPEEK